MKLLRLLLLQGLLVVVRVLQPILLLLPNGKQGARNNRIANSGSAYKDFATLRQQKVQSNKLLLFLSPTTLLRR